jgi:16S rRNA G527 N7-methylase RsmG
LTGPVESEKETVTFLRRALKEAQVQVELWKGQAEEARKENLQFQIQFKSSVKVHQVELDSSQKELAQIRDEHERQGKLVKKLRAEIGELGDRAHRSRQDVN